MYLLDTNHCSRLIDGDPRIARRLLEAGRVAVALSVISRGELAYMVERSAKRQENAVKISAFLRSIRIHPIGNEIADIYGILKQRLLTRFGPRSKKLRGGFTLERLGFRDNDLWIAATALHHRLIVVSADADFDRIHAAMPDLRCENWLVERAGD